MAAKRKCLSCGSEHVTRTPKTIRNPATPKETYPNPVAENVEFAWFWICDDYGAGHTDNCWGSQCDQ